MNLPKLETPKYGLNIPSTGKTIEYRPFLVKEEKILLIAQQTNKSKAMFKAMLDVIDSCTFGKLKMKDLTNFDVEYIFLKLRQKSVGEVASLNIKCKECEASNPIEVNLEEVKIDLSEDKEKKVMLTDSVGVLLKYISALSVEKLASLEKDQDKLLTETVIQSIDHIFDENGVYPIKEANRSELEEFINSLNREQISKIEDFISSAPKLNHTLNFDCIKCELPNEVVLEGAQTFFV